MSNNLLFSRRYEDSFGTRCGPNWKLYKCTCLATEKSRNAQSPNKRCWSLERCRFRISVWCHQLSYVWQAILFWNPSLRYKTCFTSRVQICLKIILPITASLRWYSWLTSTNVTNTLSNKQKAFLWCTAGFVSPYVYGLFTVIGRRCRIDPVPWSFGYLARYERNFWPTR